MSDYRVGWFWSSATPGTRVRCLAEGAEIAEYEKRGDFIEWCDADPLKYAVDIITDHLDELIGECLTGKVSPKTIARMRGYLPARCINAYRGQ